MVHAYVMLVTAAGKSSTVVDAVRNIEGATEAHVIAGEFDVIAELETEAVSDLLHVVSSEIGGLEGVGATRTYIALA